MNIKIDSRKIKNKDIFVGLKTLNNDGNDYAFDAIKRGASKVILEHNPNIIFVKDTREYLAKYLFKNYYKKIKNIKLIGITGTNGKTTSSFLIYQALNKLGIKTAYIGTIGFYMDKFICLLNNTTPELIDIYEMLLKCEKEKYEYVVMEVSSHALSMNRVKYLKFKYAIFTNLTQDHLNYHKSMEKYANEKTKLFDMCENAIINIDDNYSNLFIKDKNNNYTYGIDKGNYKISNIKLMEDYSTFKVNNILYKTNLLGIFNIYNLLNVIIILDLIGINNKDKKRIIKLLKEPKGRMQIIKYKSNKIVIDYAHTPDAVLNIIKTFKEFVSNNIYVLIGCGGNRDKTKRSIMANICTNECNFSIFTSDNPRNENVYNIINDMISNIKNNNYKVIVDRKEAIKYGISLLKEKDILLILGKGHENYQIIGNKKNHFDDYEEVLNML